MVRISLAGILEHRSAYRLRHEDEMARRWFALPPGTTLPLSDGSACQLLYAGRGGSAAGPDVHDAVLLCGENEAHRVVGDVEFHIYASDWFAHGHATDPRYNSVILHVVLVCDTARPITCSNGTTIPQSSLQDVVTALPLPGSAGANTHSWPCRVALLHMSEAERTNRLQQGGVLRFEQKAHTFVEQLHQARGEISVNVYDTCLLLSIAEGLGYGRDRAFFRAVGHYLLGRDHHVPEPLGRSMNAPALDASRLVALRRFIERWREGGLWTRLKAHLCSPAEGMEQGDVLDVVMALRSLFSGVGTARADILICNCILPFALAVALLEQDMSLAERATLLYREYPGLSSNRITRAMQRQLLLPVLPHGACQQQGLHYIYAQACREKHCDGCLFGKRGL